VGKLASQHNRVACNARVFIAILGLIGCIGGHVNAAQVVYTDRALFTAALAGTVTTENFNSYAHGTAVTPATVFPSGIVVTGIDTVISNFAFSSIGQGNALLAFDDYTVAMPGAVTAFGFDYADLDFSGLQIVVGANTYTLALTGDADTSVTPDDFAFFGIVGSSPLDIPGSIYLAHFPGFEGTVIDNLTFADDSVGVAVPLPSAAWAGLGLCGILGIVRFGRPKRA
jgi:hypothetical protein